MTRDPPGKLLREPLEKQPGFIGESTRSSGSGDMATWNLGRHGDMAGSSDMAIWKLGRHDDITTHPAGWFLPNTFAVLFRVTLSFIKVGLEIIFKSPFTIRTKAVSRVGLADPDPNTHLFTAENKLSVTSVKTAFVNLNIHQLSEYTSVTTLVDG